MPVDAQLQPILDLIAASESVPPMELGPVGLRQMFDAMCGAFGPGPAGVDTLDVALVGRDGPIRSRLYRPSSLGAAVAAPTLLYLHGGGFVIGSIDTHDTLCRSLAEA
ncbi:MAG: alpha/beta hydrolase fold domain-containing protein, partial [Actinobacteria bacterium]|nr:alpha/beta hydrolase fold domain-containing protein [Actinomycetota bacterium]